jgi:hypothetical protein
VELIDQVPLLDISAAPMNTHISLCGVFLVILFLSYTIIHWVVHLSIIAKVDLCFDTAFFLQTGLITPNMELRIKFIEYLLINEALL